MPHPSNELDKIRSDIEKNLICPLKDSATNLVFGKGNPNAKIIIIGEAPGKNEDLQGIPFVGKAGKHLDELLNTINLKIEDVYICNILKYRPPENRDPLPDEIERHTPFLLRQIDAIKPEIIVTLGNFSTKFILAESDLSKMDSIPGITRLHGKHRQITLNNQKYLVFPVFHPAAAIYNRKLLPELKNDFIHLGELLKSSKSVPNLKKWLYSPT